MKRLSLQWRLTLMTAVLIAATCIFLNLALSRAGMFYMDKLGQAIFHQTPTADFMISIPGADVEQLPPDTNQRYQENFYAQQLADHPSDYAGERLYYLFCERLCP